ncbi:tRNA pseudouridine(13) synthase TruD [Wenzhouxiangella sp. AB-CW3]|uniref:tRNA pseudouridine(13) synthase TruD n=1 Tax=Wenzhouxiangella sp. AB-CW3 TaxID=2771012 RepID=UPI00168B9DB3|nr:tRNA pseudouridine(13) synthase TruD [Wenzhouxiangella sp. AB-CW3]QOC21674.1 tRNA pseudouridine(13) synthase TruD [Wenzhouxiangella sp. AB-CW3]
MSEFAWGGPPVRGCIRSTAEDFHVEEILGHEPDGKGEHLWLWVEKRECNTVEVAGRLADAAGVHPRQVSFAGLKDRNAVTRQYFSIHLPGRDDPDTANWALDGIRILQAVRSSRKIKRGRLKANRFRLRVRELEGDMDALEARLATVSRQGVPNGFGEQRFGGNNIARAHALFRGELRRKPSKSKRGFYLSAARSLVFNKVLAERLRRGDWHQLIDGDLAVLDGSRSFFAADAADPEQIRRCTELDIHPSGPLPGRGESPAAGEAAAIEQTVFAEQSELVEGLAKFGMQQERRALRMRVKDLEWSYPEPHTLELTFELNTGSYATSVLRELVDYKEG